MKIKSALFEGLYDMYAGRHQPENLRRLTDLYWRTLLSLALVVVVGVFTYGILTLNRVLDALGDAYSVAPTPAPALDRAKLNTTVDGFEARGARFEALKARADLPSDPSK